MMHRAYLPPATHFVRVDVPELPYFMLDGKGAPGGEPFQRGNRWLFTAVQPIRRVARERMGRSFVEAPLQGPLVGG